MEIIRRFGTLIIFLYITGKWLGLTAWWIISASLVWAEGFFFLLVPSHDGGVPYGVLMAIYLIVPLVILSVLEWLIFGKPIWSYKSFRKRI